MPWTSRAPPPGDRRSPVRRPRTARNAGERPSTIAPNHPSRHARRRRPPIGRDDDALALPPAGGRARSRRSTRTALNRAAAPARCPRRTMDESLAAVGHERGGVRCPHRKRPVAPEHHLVLAEHRHYGVDHGRVVRQAVDVEAAHGIRGRLDLRGDAGPGRIGTTLPAAGYRRHDATATHEQHPQAGVAGQDLAEDQLRPRRCPSRPGRRQVRQVELVQSDVGRLAGVEQEQPVVGRKVGPQWLQTTVGERDRAAPGARGDACEPVVVAWRVAADVSPTPGTASVRGCGARWVCRS